MYISLIVVLSLILRLINLNQSLWFDEAINVVYAKSNDFWWFVTKYPVGDFHPPGWFAILWIWGRIFGFSEIAVRLPSVILGAVTVGLTFLLGKELFNKKAGLLASLLLAIAPLHVYYSQEARMYVFAAFSVALSFYFLNRLTLNKKWACLGYTVSLILVLYSDYLAYLVIPSQIFYLFWVRKLNRKVLMSYLMAGVMFIPWLSIFPLQFQTGINKSISLPGWGQVVGGSNIKNLLIILLKVFFGKVTLLNKYFYIGISALVGLINGSIFIFGFKRLDQSTKLIISWIFIPVILAFLISFFIPVLSYFRMIYILPPVYLILSKGIENLPKKFAVPAFIFICFVSVVSLAGYYLNPQFQREDWRKAVNFVSQKLDNQTLVVFENNEIPAPVKYYSQDISNFMPGLSVDLFKNLEGKKKVFLFEYLVDIYDPERSIEKNLKSFHFIENKTYNFHGVGFIKLYVKD